MRARMTVTDGLQSIFSKLVTRLAVPAKMAQLLGHLNAITHYYVVFAGTKEVFLVHPGRANQRNAASQGLKYANRGNTGQSIRILAARDVHGNHAFRIDLRRKKIGQIAAIFNVGVHQLLQRMLWIADSMSDHAHFRQGPRRLDQELFQLGGAFIVAPVADPYNVNLFAALERMELLDVSGFMKSPCPVYAETINIDAADGLAKGKNAIHQVQMEFEDFTGPSVSAMMAIMEQRDEAELLFQREHLVYDLRIIPLVQQNEISLFQFLFQKPGKLRVTRFIETDVEFGISAAEGIDGLNCPLAFLLHQVCERPCTQLFITTHVVAHPYQFPHQPAQKVGIAMVPVRDNGVGKQSDIKLLAHALSACAGIN